ncbi:MAG: SH3 domain-containing protein [Thermoanaerobaculia bacterium]|nr:SH3 domain-containing protein [Thermoanaerobaculia bacterium]
MKKTLILATIAITLIAACGREEAPPEPAARETIAIKFAAGDLEIREAPKDDAALITTYKTGESVSILGEQGEWSEIKISFEKSGWARTAALAANKADVGSTAGEVRFRIAPEPVTQPGAHGVIRLEATVNVHGDVTGVRTLENTTGRTALELLTAESLRKAKFFPLLQDGKAQQFVYEYTATF